MNTLSSGVAPSANLGGDYSVEASPLFSDDLKRKAKIIECQTISVEAAGKVLAIARNTAYAAARAGQIPTVRIGRRIRVPKAALQRLLDGEAAPGVGGRS